MIFRRFLTIAPVCATLVAGAGAAPATKRCSAPTPRSARAIRTSSRATRPRSQGHVLEPWAEYWQLRLRIEDAKSADVQRFLTRQPGHLPRRPAARRLAEGTRPARRLAGLRARARAAGAGRPRDCAATRWSARLARGDGDAAVEARAAWLEPRELPDGCVPLADKLLRSGAIDQRATSGSACACCSDNGQVSAARRALGYLPATRAARRAPAHAGGGGAAKAPRPAAEEPGEARHARDAAVRRDRGSRAATRAPLRRCWRARSASSLPAQERELPVGAGRHARARWSTCRRRSTGTRSPATRRSADEHLAWKARAALRAGQWQTVRDGDRSDVDPGAAGPCLDLLVRPRARRAGRPGRRARLLPAHRGPALLLQPARHRGTGRSR